jgi:beta-glucosidase
MVPGREHSGESAVEDRVEDLLGRLTLVEKVALLSGRDVWRTAAIERLGIPSLVMTDGPHGVRADRPLAERAVSPATSFPTGVSMAASWNPALVERVGVALGEEARALGCDILLGPCVNIVRAPLAGRNYESYSEDPYLAGRIGVAVVAGVQSLDVGASVKHFACNNQEFERFRGNSVVDERTLREIYLPAFEAIVKEARPWTVMCSYNRLNGVYLSENDHLLNGILKKEWGFDGVVISDWGANHTTVESVRGGLDIEMPGPAKYYGNLLVEAVRNWQIAPEAVDEAARRVLRMLVRSGRLDAKYTPPAGALDTPGHRALARELAEESIVLLKNTGGLLPLEGIRSVAVIGPNAAEARIGGGGSSYLEPPYRVSPLEGLRAALGESVEVAHEPGCDNYYELPPMESTWLTPARGAGSGLWGEYFDNTDLLGEPVADRVDETVDFWGGGLPEEVPREAYSVRWTGQLTIPTTGRYAFSLASSGECRSYLDGELLVETVHDLAAPPVRPQGVAPVHVRLDAGRAYGLRVEFVKPAGVGWNVARVLSAYAPPSEEDDRIARAVDLAQRSEVAIIFGGMPRGYETEGLDRPGLALPGRQAELIGAVAQANAKTIVVLNCGAPVEMGWLDDVPAVVLAFYPGQEGGNAIARLLLGKVNPSGKLPVTFPRRIEDNPTFINYPGGREVRYGEGVFVGYRYYDAKDIEPLFPFGFGLSYTTFEYSDLRVTERARLAEEIEVSVTVTNAGTRAGKEIVQLYVHDAESALPRPPKELKRFEKVALEPGKSAQVRFVLDQRALSFYEPHAGRWVAEPGEYEILVGSSSRDIRARFTFTLLQGLA